MSINESNVSSTKQMNNTPVQPKHIRLISIQRNDTNPSVSNEEEDHPKKSTRPNHLVNLKVNTGAAFDEKHYNNGKNIDNSA